MPLRPLRAREIVRKLEHAGEPRDGLEVLVQPVRQLAASHAARSEIQDETFLILDRGSNLRAIQHQECLHRCMPHPLVAVNEGMPLDQRKAQRGGLLRQRGIQIDATEGGLGLRDCRLKRTEITEPCGTAGDLEKSSV